MNESRTHPLITIIVPIYRVEQYLDRCVKSLVNQTYTKIEILLVDDGSPDSCPMLCEEWGKRDTRIKVLHKENGGLSDARNYGIVHAKGEYVSFVDSDDYVSTNYIKYLYGLIEKTSADTSCCILKTVTSGDEKFVQVEKEHLRVLTGKEACADLYNGNYAQMVVSCGKLYRTSIVRKNMYPKGRLHEDEATTYKFLYDSKKVVVSNCALYAYFQNVKSITHTRSKKNEQDISIAYYERVAYFRERKEWDLYAKTVNFYTGVVMARGDSDSALEVKTLLKKYRMDYHVFLRTKLRMYYFIMKTDASTKR